MKRDVKAWQVVTYVAGEAQFDRRCLSVFTVTQVFIQDEAPGAKQIEEAVLHACPWSRLLMSEVQFAPIPDELLPGN
jgi:hypothetical protein